MNAPGSFDLIYQIVCLSLALILLNFRIFKSVKSNVRFMVILLLRLTDDLMTVK